MEIILNNRKLAASIIQAIHECGHLDVMVPMPSAGIYHYSICAEDILPVRNGAKVIGHISRVRPNGEITIQIADIQFEDNFITEHLPGRKAAYKLIEKHNKEN